MRIAQGVGIMLVVAGTYAWFLLFAQFAFLEIVKANVGDGNWLKAILTPMTIGGIGGGFVVASKVKRLRRWLALGLWGGAATTLFAGFPVGTVGLFLVSFLTGVSLAITTVVMAGILGGVSGKQAACLWVGLGTGLAYAFCNLPWIFQATPTHQAWIIAVVCFTTSLVVRLLPEESNTKGEWLIPWRAMLAFAALVWMDSAAFYIIQHTDTLKRATWNSGMLERNAVIHFLAAAIAGWWLAKGGLRSLLAMAWLLIAFASIAASYPTTREWCGWIYPIGVSLYSTAFTAWPGLLARNQEGERIHPAMRRGAWIFGIAGWVASALGIAIAEGRQHIPLAILLIAGVALAGSMLPLRQFNSRPQGG